jgi:glucan phosphoethanolaminetransferase (alkaline phosphatase superfamily)
MLLKAEEAVGTVSFWWIGLVAFFLAYILFSIHFSEQKWDRRLLIVTLLVFLCFAAVSSRLFSVTSNLHSGDKIQTLGIAFAPLLIGGAALVAARFVHWMTERMFG